MKQKLKNMNWIQIGILVLTIITFFWSLFFKTEDYRTAFIDCFFCLLILFDFIYINDKKTSSNIENITDIKAISNKKFPKNVVGESIKIIIGTQGKYSLIYETYENNRRIKIIILLVINVISFVIGMGIAIVFKHENNYFIFLLKGIVVISNVVFIFCDELENSSPEVFVEKFDINKVKINEKEINDFYEENASNAILLEELVEFGRQSYYMIIITKEKKRIRSIIDLIILGISIMLIYDIFTSKLQISLDIYPNYILLLFCIFSNSKFFEKISEHYIILQKGINVSNNSSNCVNLLYPHINNGKGLEIFTLIINKKTRIESISDWINNGR